MAVLRPPRRRRQRSVRVTVSLVLLATATALVLASLPTQSPLWLSVASVLALVLSWAALRMMWTEVLQSRRENAADRAAAASAYRSLFTVRAAEHAEFTTAMTERLAEAHLSQRELEGRVAQQESRADDAESSLLAAREQLEVLETALAVRRAEESQTRALWAAAGEADGIVELVDWEGQVTEKMQQAAKARKPRKRA